MSILSAQYPRYGYRRIQIILGRQSHQMSSDWAWRLWRLAGLQGPRKRPRRHVSVRRPGLQPASAARHVWAYDFVFDACANGLQLKCLTVIDEYTRECLAIDVAGPIRSKRVIEVLSQLASVHGAPRYLHSDNGPEFVSRAILKWAAENGTEMALSDPGKPWQNVADESFNGQFRDECLSLDCFRTRAVAKVVIKQWRRHYNAIRPKEIPTCQQVGITTYVSRPITSGSRIEGCFGKTDFIYIARDDEYQCRAGQRLRWHQTTLEHGMNIRAYWTYVCPPLFDGQRCYVGLPEKGRSPELLIRCQLNDLYRPLTC